MEEPLSPMFWIIGWSGVGDFTSLYIEDEYDNTQEVYLR